MGKIRINDLARELEVKSRVILEALPAVGFTERKTHSSAVEEEVADRVRRYIRRGGMDVGAFAPSLGAEEASEGGRKRSKARGAKAAAPEAAPETAAEVVPEPAAAAPAEEPAAPPAEPAAPRVPELPARVTAAEPPPPTPPTPAPPAPRARPQLRPAAPIAPAAPMAAGAPKLPVAPPRPVYAPPSAPVAPASLRPSVPVAGAAPAASPLAPSKAGRPVAPRPPLAPSAAPPQAPGAVRPRGLTPAPASPPARPQPPKPPSLNIASGGITAAPSPSSPGRRVIVPVAPQRPVYQAPAGGAPVRPGRPAPGKPIYQRPATTRPGSAPMGRAATPEGRRPMHPTRPSGNRGAGPRSAHHGRREPRVKEGAQPKYYERPTTPSGPLPINREITLSEGITVKDLSERLQVRAKDVIRKLLDRGLMVTVNQPLESETAIAMAREFGASATVVSFEEEALKSVEEARGAEAEPAKLTPRAPVVTIMGHVDHGKTSLLDAIRETSVAAGEAGGITQHIGAYKVEVTDPDSPAHGRAIVFIDTPGHEAFTRMRARGAKVTDVVVLVVSADDGVMPQTLEAIDHAKSANVPLLVAINKIDKPDAQPDRVKKQLAERGLQPEDWGGTTVMVNVSAKAKTNLNQLLEMIVLVADLQEPKANPDAPGQGTVLEAQLDRGRGPVARVLVQDGTLRTGDTIVLGSVLGRVRAMFDDRGRSLPAAGPSTPVEVLGLEALPEAGDRFTVVNDRLKAKQIAVYREEKAREAAHARASRINLDVLSQQMGSGGEAKELPLIVKADVQGSAEVLVDTLNKLSTPKVRIRVIHSGVGAITEGDVLLATAANAVIIGFNVRPERKAAELAEHEKIEIRQHSIIYEVTEEIQKAMTGLLEPVVKETPLGHAEVRQTFRIPKVGAIAGCYVRDGKLTRDAPVRVVRDGAVVYTGKIASLRRVKEDVSEVRSGLECGVGVSNFADVKPGDVLEAFQVERVAATL